MIRELLVTDHTVGTRSKWVHNLPHLSNLYRITLVEMKRQLTLQKIWIGDYLTTFKTFQDFNDLLQILYSKTLMAFRGLGKTKTRPFTPARLCAGSATGLVLETNNMLSNTVARVHTSLCSTDILDIFFIILYKELVWSLSVWVWFPEVMICPVQFSFSLPHFMRFTCFHTCRSSQSTGYLNSHNATLLCQIVHQLRCEHPAVLIPCKVILRRPLTLFLSLAFYIQRIRKKH